MRFSGFTTTLQIGQRSVLANAAPSPNDGPVQESATYLGMTRTKPELTRTSRRTNPRSGPGFRRGPCRPRARSPSSSRLRGPPGSRTSPPPCTSHGCRRRSCLRIEPRALADVLLDELGSDEPDERGLRAVRDGLGEERLPGARWPDKEDAFWRLDANLPVQVRFQQRILHGLAQLAHLDFEAADVFV